MKFQFGSTARHVVSGFQGVVIGYARYANGCTQYLLCPRVGDDGKFPGSEWLDEQHLDLVNTAYVDRYTAHDSESAGPGGDTRPPRSYRSR